MRRAELRSLTLIDEPDIYLHAELQRQLLGLLRNLGPDILIATHSTEIITEAETDDIVLVLEEVFTILGSNINPVLTQIAKTKRALFVEGKDFQILSRFARKLGNSDVGNRSSFAVIPVEGFNPERIRSLKRGIEATLGSKIVAAAILDRDYRSDNECEGISKECMAFCGYVTIHNRKEIENFLLVPAAIDRAAELKVEDKARRSATVRVYDRRAKAILEDFSQSKKSMSSHNI